MNAVGTGVGAGFGRCSRPAVRGGGARPPPLRAGWSLPRPAGKLAGMGLAQIKMPQLGESVTEGTVDKWLKNEGDFVKRDEPIVEVVTDKVNAEIQSPFEGKLVKITAAQGETVLVGAVIAQIEVAGASPAPAAPAKAESKAAEAPPVAVAAAPAAEVAVAGAGTGGARLSPAVRKLAAEHGLDPTTLRGSGLGGRVTRDDILAAVGSGTAAPTAAKAETTVPQPPRDGSREELVKLSIMRRSIAEHMVRSLATSPHAWTLQEIDVTNLVRYRESEKEGFKARHGVDRPQAGCHRRWDCRPQHDEHVLELRPSHHRRHDGGPVPRFHQKATRGMDGV